MRPAFFVLILLLSGCGLHEQSYTALVIEKVYSPSHSSSGIGFTSGGKTAFVSSYESDRYVLIIQRMDDYSTRSKQVSAAQWVGAKVGDKITFTEVVF